jgi:hypothetical protein
VLEVPHADLRIAPPALETCPFLSLTIWPYLAVTLRLTHTLLLRRKDGYLYLLCAPAQTAIGPAKLLQNWAAME